jgi:hypothetical protein
MVTHKKVVNTVAGRQMTLLRHLALVVGVAITPIITPIQASAQGDADSAQRLVAGSPWEGGFGYGDAGGSAGALTVRFSVVDGSLSGEVTSVSGRTTVQPGPLAQLDTRGGNVSFVTPSNGVHYDLRWEDEKLTGRWFGRTSGWITLSPTAKKS